MASVRMTRDLMRAITNNADSTYRKANPPPSQDKELIALTKTAYENAPGFLKVKKCCKEYDKLSEDEKRGFDLGIGFYNVSEVSIRSDDRRLYIVTLDTPMQTFNTSYYGSDFHLESALPEHQTPLLEAITNCKNKEDAWKKAHSSYMGDIDTLLYKCNTLKQLLTLWPGAEHLVPEEYIQKMHEKTPAKTRTEQVLEEINIDQSRLDQTVLTARVMGA